MPWAVGEATWRAGELSPKPGMAPPNPPQAEGGAGTRAETGQADSRLRPPCPTEVKARGCPLTWQTEQVPARALVRTKEGGGAQMLHL